MWPEQHHPLEQWCSHQRTSLQLYRPSVLQSLEDLRLVDQPVSGSGGMAQVGAPGWGPSSAALPSSSQWVSQPAQPQGAGWQQGVQGGWQAGPGRAHSSAGVYGAPGRTQQW